MFYNQNPIYCKTVSIITHYSTCIRCTQTYEGSSLYDSLMLLSPESVSHPYFGEEVRTCTFYWKKQRSAQLHLKPHGIPTMQPTKHFSPFCPPTPKYNSAHASKTPVYLKRKSWFLSFQTSQHASQYMADFNSDVLKPVQLIDNCYDNYCWVHNKKNGQSTTSYLNTEFKCAKLTRIIHIRYNKFRTELAIFQRKLIQLLCLLHLEYFR